MTFVIGKRHGVGYNIFRFLNMARPHQLKQIAATLKAIAAPDRLAILMAIGEGEACVCHLEAALSQRQATISQHLMALRQAGLLFDRREGRFVYYRLARPAVLELVRDAGLLVDVTLAPTLAAPLSGCACPPCAGQTVLLSVGEAAPDASTLA